MRRPVDAADPARHVLLGLLLDGPRHGYDLARAFAPGTALGAVVHLGSSHLYALLTGLERGGLVQGMLEEQGARPPRRVYSISEAGRREVLRWVEEPVARPRDVLLDFPLKLYLARHLNPQRAAELVARQRALFVRYLDGLVHEAPDPALLRADRDFVELIRRGRVARTEATIAWLDACAGLLLAPGAREARV